MANDKLAMFAGLRKAEPDFRPDRPGRGEHLEPQKSTASGDQAAIVPTQDTEADVAPAIERIDTKLDLLLRRTVINEKRFFQISEAAAYTALSEKSIRRLLASGKLTSLRPVRGRVLVDRVELDSLVLGSTASPRKGRGMDT